MPKRITQTLKRAKHNHTRKMSGGGKTIRYKTNKLKANPDYINSDAGFGFNSSLTFSVQNPSSTTIIKNLKNKFPNDKLFQIDDKNKIINKLAGRFGIKLANNKIENTQKIINTKSALTFILDNLIKLINSDNVVNNPVYNEAQNELPNNEARNEPPNNEARNVLPNNENNEERNEPEPEPEPVLGAPPSYRNSVLERHPLFQGELPLREGSNNIPPPSYTVTPHIPPPPIL